MPFQSQLEKIAPTWMNVSLRMKDDKETDKAFGWVLEMWDHFTSMCDFILPYCLMVCWIHFLMIFYVIVLRYGYAVASALHGVQHILRKDFMIQVFMCFASLKIIQIFHYSNCWSWHAKFLKFIFQPPWDLKLGNTYIIHYTYGCDYSLKVILYL